MSSYSIWGKRNICDQGKGEFAGTDERSSGTHQRFSSPEEMINIWGFLIEVYRVVYGAQLGGYRKFEGENDVRAQMTGERCIGEVGQNVGSQVKAMLCWNWAILHEHGEAVRTIRAFGFPRGTAMRKFRFASCCGRRDGATFQLENGNNRGNFISPTHFIRPISFSSFPPVVICYQYQY